jgi:hypothetical protein
LKPRWPRNLFWQAPPPPPQARIVVFTGHPRPHEALLGQWPAPWQKKFYKTRRPVSCLAEHWK